MSSIFINLMQIFKKIFIDSIIYKLEKMNEEVNDKEKAFEMLKVIYMSVKSGLPKLIIKVIGSYTSLQTIDTYMPASKYATIVKLLICIIFAFLKIDISLLAKIFKKN